MKLPAALLFAALAMSACASTPPPAAPLAAGEAGAEKLVCQTEHVMGSIRPRRVCRTATQRSAELEAARRTSDRINDARPESRAPGS